MAAEDNCSKRHPLAIHMAGWILLTINLAACGILQPLEIHKVALLAPFEGPFREFGYNALYAARLAMSDENLENVQLLPIDDGGNIMSAAARIRALNLDSAVMCDHRARRSGHASVSAAIQRQTHDSHRQLGA